MRRKVAIFYKSLIITLNPVQEATNHLVTWPRMQHTIFIHISSRYVTTVIPNCLVYL